MRLLSFFLLTLSLNAQAKLDVHEWGTFTSLVGSNGETQNGMYHEDEPLPPFVHGFGEVARDAEPQLSPTVSTPKPPPCGKGCLPDGFIQNNVISQKMETPVVYFYSDKVIRNLSMNVKFPDGVLTETYPGPTRTYPTKTDKAIVGNGNTTFTVDVLDPKAIEALQPVNPGNIYGHARNVAANIVKYRSEAERFIFYRGLGRFQPRINILSNKGNVTFQASASATPKSAFLVHVAPNGAGQLMEVSGIGGRVAEVKASMIDELKNPNTRHPAILSGAAARGALDSALTKAGLNADEAKAMLDTWENGYLKVPGLRFLYVLPRLEVDQLLPLTISPKPDSLVRVFVARIEILLDTEEIAIMKDVLKLGGGFDVKTLGRFAEPILRRVSIAYVEYCRQNDLEIDKQVISDFQNLIMIASKGTAASTSAH